MRSLVDIVKDVELVNTDYLTTLFVVVPKALYKDWLASYETLTNYVLPRSSRLITEDQEFGTYL